MAGDETARQLGVSDHSAAAPALVAVVTSRQNTPRQRLIAVDTSAPRSRDARAAGRHWPAFAMRFGRAGGDRERSFCSYPPAPAASRGFSGDNDRGMHRHC